MKSNTLEWTRQQEISENDRKKLKKESEVIRSKGIVMVVDDLKEIYKQKCDEKSISDVLH